MSFVKNLHFFVVVIVAVMVASLLTEISIAVSRTTTLWIVQIVLTKKKIITMLGYFNAKKKLYVEF